MNDIVIVSTKQVAILTLLDFSMVFFDATNHGLLRVILHHIGFKSYVCKLLSSSLSDRIQTVIMSDKCFCLDQVLCGVPQMSILELDIFDGFMGHVQYPNICFAKNVKIKICKALRSSILRVKLFLC